MSHFRRHPGLVCVTLGLLLILLLVGCSRSQPEFYSEINQGLSPDMGSGADAMEAAPQKAEGVRNAPEPATGAELNAELAGNVPAAPESVAGAEAEAPAADAVVAQPIAFIDDPNRKIIKNADLTIEVERVQIAVSRVSNAAAEAGGYVLETRTNFGEEGAEGAVMQIAVPVDNFEATLERIRSTATRIIDEQISGVDVTQEFVDVQSQLANLEATQARIREFLDQAESVEEALDVNTELSEVEAQISQLKGRLQYLSQRATYSTITVQLQQMPPEITPTPTPSPTPTITPTPEPVWSPGQTAGHAYGTLTDILEVVATLAIWLVVVVLPLLLPVGLLWLGVRAVQRRNRSRTQPVSSPTPATPTTQEPAGSGTSTD